MHHGHGHLGRGWIFVGEMSRRREKPPQLGRFHSGTRESLIEVALPHRKFQPTEAACWLLKSLPASYEPGALDALLVREAA